MTIAQRTTLEDPKRATVRRLMPYVFVALWCAGFSERRAEERERIPPSRAILPLVCHSKRKRKVLRFSALLPQ